MRSGGNGKMEHRNNVRNDEKWWKGTQMKRWKQRREKEH